MKIKEIHPLSIIAIPVALFAFNRLLAQIGLRPIDYADWAIWVIFVCLILSSFKLTFK